MDPNDRSGASPLRRNSSFRRLIKAWASGIHTRLQTRTVFSFTRLLVVNIYHETLITEMF